MAGGSVLPVADPRLGIAVGRRGVPVSVSTEGPTAARSGTGRAGNDRGRFLRAVSAGHMAGVPGTAAGAGDFRGDRGSTQRLAADLQPAVAMDRQAVVLAVSLALAGGGVDELRRLAGRAGQRVTRHRRGPDAGAGVVAADRAALRHTPTCEALAVCHARHADCSGIHGRRAGQCDSRSDIAGAPDQSFGKGAFHPGIR